MCYNEVELHIVCDACIVVLLTVIGSFSAAA
jgi:hypothetical protein